MVNQSLMKRIRIFGGKVKTASNIATLLFLAALGCTISRWHKVSGFDSFIDILITVIILFINTRLYKIHLNLHGDFELLSESQILSVYKTQKQHYSQLVAAALMMLGFLVITNLLLR